MTRRIYLDNIRWITVVIVVIYHVIYMYNGIQVAGVVGPFSKVQYQDAIQYIVYPWFMVLLFVISGMCSRYYLENHTNGEFIKSRTVKLLVPSTIGLFVFQWIQGYYNMKLSGAADAMLANFPAQIKYFVAYPIFVVSGTGVLWYIQVLWLFSLVLVLIRKIEKDKLFNFGKKANLLVLILLALVIWGSAQILNTPIVVVYRFGIYGAAFLIGYFVLSHDEVTEKLGKAWIGLAIAAVALCVAFVILYWGEPYAEASVLKTPLCNLYAWIAVLAIISFMSVKGNFENKFSEFMNKESWGLYVFHYLPLSMCAYYMSTCAKETAPILFYIATAVSAFAGAFIINSIISRIPVLRWCVLGISKKKKQ